MTQSKIKLTAKQKQKIQEVMDECPRPQFAPCPNKYLNNQPDAFDVKRDVQVGAVIHGIVTTSTLYGRTKVSPVTLYVHKVNTSSFYAYPMDELYEEAPQHKPHPVTLDDLHTNAPHVKGYLDALARDIQNDPTSQYKDVRFHTRTGKPARESAMFGYSTYTELISTNYHVRDQVLKLRNEQRLAHQSNTELLKQLTQVAGVDTDLNEAIARMVYDQMQHMIYKK